MKFKKSILSNQIILNLKKIFNTGNYSKLIKINPKEKNLNKVNSNSDKLSAFNILNFLEQNKLIILIKSKTEVYFKEIKTFFGFLSYKTQKISSTKLKNKTSQSYGIAYYSDHILTMSKLAIDANKRMLVTGAIEIPIPGHIIGDNLVEDINELSQITLDVVNILGLRNQPLLVILASSFFKIHTFTAEEVKERSKADFKIQSRSPYLPNDTTIDFLSLPENTNQHKFHRAVYAQKKSIKSWTDTLEILNMPIIAITPAGPQIFDMITQKIVERLTILVDIECKATTVLIGKKESQLYSFKLPYGCSLYTASYSPEISKSYFTRLVSSIEAIVSEKDEILPKQIYVIGQGLDELMQEDQSLPAPFSRVEDLKLSNYIYAPNQMDVHELMSKSISSKIDTTSSIASECI